MILQVWSQFFFNLHIGVLNGIYIYIDITIYIYNTVFHGHTSFRIISMISLLSRFGIPDIAYLLASLGASCGRLPTSGRLRAVRSKCEELYQAHGGARLGLRAWAQIWSGVLHSCRFLCPKRNNDWSRPKQGIHQKTWWLQWFQWFRELVLSIMLTL